MLIWKQKNNLSQTFQPTQIDDAKFLYHKNLLGKVFKILAILLGSDKHF